MELIESVRADCRDSILDRSQDQREKIISTSAENFEELWIELDKFLSECAQKLRNGAADERENTENYENKEKQDKGKEVRHSDDAEDAERIGLAQSVFDKDLAERVCPLIDGFYMVCSKDIPHSLASTSQSKTVHKSKERFVQFVGKLELVNSFLFPLHFGNLLLICRFLRL